MALLFGSHIAFAQVPASDAAARLREVLPADVATRVLAVIEKARSRDLPADALENRALKFAARGVNPSAIERAVAEHAARMEEVRETLLSARSRKPAGDEIEAGAEAVRKGVDGAKVSALAKSTPSGRSLAVPLYVIGSLVDRGLPSDSALRRVQERLTKRASDVEIEKLPDEVRAKGLAAADKKPAETGGEIVKIKKPDNPTGTGPITKAPGAPPSGVPANGGKTTKPNTPPTTPPGQGKTAPTTKP
ncbi:MAG: hypothetical protein V4550_20260 [Gemmatimonadota bacterium]